jgi:hypothetical protein
MLQQRALHLIHLQTIEMHLPLLPQQGSLSEAYGIVPSIFSFVGPCLVFLLAHKRLPATVSVQGTFFHMFQSFPLVLFISSCLVFSAFFNIDLALPHLRCFYSLLILR